MLTFEAWKSLGWVLLPVAVFLAAWWGYVDTLPHVQLPFDDSYIAQQYARHLFLTSMLTFDGTRPSRGATSPPHVFLLALCRQMTSDPVVAALVVGLVCHTGFLVVLCLLMRKLGFQRAVAVSVMSAAASCGFLVVDSLNGLETSMFHLLATILVLAALRVRDARGLALLATVVWLVCWCRPEGVLLAGAFMLILVCRVRDGMFSGRSHPVLIALLFLGPLLVLIGHSWPGPPPSWKVKMVFYGEVDLPLTEKIRIAARGIAPFAYFLRWYLVIPLIALSLRLVLRLWARLIGQPLKYPSPEGGLPPWLPHLILGFVAAFYAVYTWCLPSSLGYLDFRYQHVLLPWVFVTVAWGFQVIVSSVSSVWMRRVVFSLLLMALAFGSTMTYVGSRKVYAACGRSVENVLVPLAARLGQMAGPRDMVATHDVGVLGYYSGLPIVDLVGLTNPDRLSMSRQAPQTARDQVLQAGCGFLVIHRSWDDLYLHIDPERPDSGFRYLFQTEPAFGDRYRVYRFGE